MRLHKIYSLCSYASCDETILHLNFINDTHELDKEEIQDFLTACDNLGSKINKFIQYVEAKWNQTLNQ
ncbi:MAG: four helix bundle protein [Deltaproteobacteria bacterium]|nr:four helix bundle protein [Deltaproteobacteria bacterium]